MSVARAFAKNTLLQLSGKMLGTFLGLLSFFLILEYFGTDGFGVYTSAMTYVTIFAILVDFGLTLTTTQLISETGANESKLLGNMVAMRTLSAIFFMALCPISAIFIPQSAGMMDVIVLGSITYFLSAVAQMFQGVFQKRLDIGIMVIAETINRTISIVGIVIAGLTGAGIPGVAAAFLIGITIQLLITFVATQRQVRFRPEIDLEVWKTILVRSWPIGVSIFFNLLYLRGDIFFMWIFNLSDTEIGQYGAAYKVMDVMTMLPVTLMGLLLPLLTMAWSQRKFQEFKMHLQNGFDILAVISIPFAFGSVLVGVELMTAVKPDLILAGQILGVLGPAITVLCFGSLYGHAVVAVNKQRPMTWAYVLVAIFAISSYILFIPTHGAWAAAWITLASELFIAVLAYIVVTRATQMRVSLRTFSRSLIASLIMSLALIFIPLPHVGLSILLGIVVYFVALSALGGPKPTSLLGLLRTEKPIVLAPNQL